MSKTQFGHQRILSPPLFPSLPTYRPPPPIPPPTRLLSFSSPPLPPSLPSIGHCQIENSIYSFFNYIQFYLKIFILFLFKVRHCYKNPLKLETRIPSLELKIDSVMRCLLNRGVSLSQPPTLTEQPKHN